MRAVDVAAPSAYVDPLAPWVDPMTRSERALAAGFWTSFHGLSAFLHLALLLLSLSATLLPIPFLMTMCADVKRVEKPIERVEMAIYHPPPPPAPPPTLLAGTGEGVAMRVCSNDADCGEGERCVDGVCVAATQDDIKQDKKKKAKGKKKKRDRDREFGMIALLSRSSGDDVASIFGAADDSGAVFGALIGDSIGEAYGAGGLGLRGSGGGGVVGGVEGGVEGGIVGGVAIGGGGAGRVGVGSIGDIGSGSGYGAGRGYLGAKTPTLSLDAAFDTASLRRAIMRHMHRLRACDIKAPVHGSLTVKDGRVVDVSTDEGNTCVERALRNAGVVTNGEGERAAFVITPR